MNELFEAVKNNNLEKVKSLIKNNININVDINKKDEYGSTLLYYASRYGNDDSIKIIKLLIENGAKINETNIRNLTALHVSSYWGHLEVAKLLIEFGSNILAKSDSGWTALHYASYKCNFEIIKLLVDDNCIDIDNMDLDGKTAIDVTEVEEIKEYLKEKMILQNTYLLK